VCAAPGQVAGVLALGVQRAGGDDRTGDLDAVQQGGEQQDLAGLSAHRARRQPQDHRQPVAHPSAVSWAGDPAQHRQQARRLSCGVFREVSKVAGNGGSQR
jgi:hypothetical protein